MEKALLKIYLVFYNHLILSGTKIAIVQCISIEMFYNHLILSGTKITAKLKFSQGRFYNHLILSGTKIAFNEFIFQPSFTIT